MGNFDFETGDLTDWTDEDETDGAGAVATSTVTTGAKRSGTYGLRLYNYADTSEYAHAMVSQAIDADFTGITFWYKVDATSDGTGEFLAQIKVHDEYHDETWYSFFSLSVSATTSYTEFSITREDLEDLLDAASLHLPETGDPIMRFASNLDLMA